MKKGCAARRDVTSLVYIFGGWGGEPLKEGFRWSNKIRNDL